MEDDKTGDGANPVLVAEINDVRPFARLLRGIGLKNMATVTVSKAGFEVTVEEVKTLCAIAWIPNTLFQTFEFNEPEADGQGHAQPACFEVSLDALLQCLNIFGNATSGPVVSTFSVGTKRGWAGEGGPRAEGEEGGGAGAGETRGGGGNASKKGRTGMRMSWQGPGHRLSVMLQDDPKGPLTTCEFNLYEPEELMNQDFNQDDCVLYLIMKSEWFRDALADLPPTSQRITLTATPRDRPRPDDELGATMNSNDRRSQRADVGSFAIKAIGDFGSTELDYPNDREVMDKFDCPEEVSFSYHSSHFALLTRALQSSIKICLQIENSGFLCVQIMMPVSEGVAMGGHSGILEFKMHALADDES
ncbi:Rad1/Rec1/Rad17 [Kockovaella imperatae]|uniref:Rad1/Rec1/Rad17 n=1 Tax=Kockovaella imperatae TaxID=4999 RepID=A0A1Y1U743_9TREE|nr:Rad1/Rec1/Rad17 [Kockovaella imperatae]ORX33853.1 Rad1/Rec1/Rad17 [Kockovaella imperatae]